MEEMTSLLLMQPNKAAYYSDIMRYFAGHYEHASPNIAKVLSVG